MLVQQQSSNQQQQVAAAGSQYMQQLQTYYNSIGALRDEAYVIEAPSFIMPYVMEGKPKVGLEQNFYEKCFWYLHHMGYYILLEGELSSR